MLDTRLRMLDKGIKNQEAALNTKSISTLSLDSLVMLMDRTNLDITISELTFNRMKNLGLTSLSNNDSLNSHISTYYNSDLAFFKSAISFVFEAFKDYQHYLVYDQEAIDLFLNDYEFTSLYNLQKEALDSINRIKRINFITSIKGRNLILMDLDRKRYSSRVLNSMQEKSVNLLKSIYAELKTQNPKMKPLQLLPSEIDFKEIEVSKEKLKTYTGKYLTKLKDTLSVILEDKLLYVDSDDSDKIQIFPYAEDKFFVEDFFAQIEFNKENGIIISFTLNGNGKFDFKKLD
jgi:hypothetical protein